MVRRRLVRVARTAASYLPNERMLAFRRVSDIPRRILGRPHEPDFLLLRDLDLAGATILDVGANRGQALASISGAVRDPVLHAVEPDPLLAEFLRSTWGGSISVYETALGDRVGAFTMYVPRYGRTLWDTRASLDPDAARGFLNDSHFWAFDHERGSVQAITVQVTTMDSLNLRPAFIKIDVEGLDWNVVAGAEETILATRPIMLIEEPQQATVDALGDVGYLPYRYEPATGSLVEADLSGLNTFFFTDEAIEQFRLGAKVRQLGR